MKKLVKKPLLAYLLASLFLFVTKDAWACTDFLIKSQDNTCVVGRSMEFAQLLPMQVQVFPRGEVFQSLAPNHQKGVSWTSQYAYIGMVFKPSKTVIDGFNERGLSIGALWLPGTQYPSPPSDAPETAIFFADIGSWLLGNFATVEQAKAALAKIKVYAGRIPGFEAIPPIHLSIQDASGKSAVLEFLNGNMYLFDNPVGVLTNSPEFPWHLTNLRNYINLSALNANAVNIDGTVLEPTGQGSGLMGIPGDWTPPSRFVRAAIFKQALAVPKDARTAILAAIHLLNTVDIPYGAIRATKNQGFDYTQWIVIKDLTNKKLYYRTYGDQNIQMISLTDNPAPKMWDLTTISP